MALETLPEWMTGLEEEDEIMMMASIVTLPVLVFTMCLALLPIALPASVISMLVLLALLMAGIVKPRHIDRVCRFLVANMAFFFVAPCAGITEHVESLLACLLPFLCAAILTTPLVYAATAWSIH